MNELRGCTNHGCLVRPLPKGAMGTNAICQCMRDPVTAQRIAYDRLKLVDEANALRARVTDLTVERDRLREDQGKLLKCIEEMAVDIGHAAPGSESHDAPHWTAWVPEEHQSFITALQEGE